MSAIDWPLGSVGADLRDIALPVSRSDDMKLEEEVSERLIYVNGTVVNVWDKLHDV